MNLLELRLLTAIAVKHKRKLKSGDVKQAFCQATLPDHEKYVLRSPAGCPHTSKNTYWLLKRTLYGLKRSPRHWYDRAVALLEQVGLKRCPKSLCMFRGTILPGKPSLYLGLYVDDFVYFSTDPSAEIEFEKRCGALTTVNFMGPVTHFLGIRFQWRESANNLEVHLSQQAFAENLIQQTRLDDPAVAITHTPFRSGQPIDSITHVEMSKDQREKLERKLRSYVGLLLWLSQGTRPD